MDVADQVTSPEGKLSTPIQTPAPEAPASNGKPWVHPTLATVLTLVFGIAIAVLGVLAAQYPDVKELQTILALVTAVGAVLGIASPGARQAAKVLIPVAIIGASSLTGCSWIKNTVARDPAAVNCLKQIGSDELTHAADIFRALAQQQWVSALETLLQNAGPGLLCEVNALVAIIEAQSDLLDAGFDDFAQL